MLDLVTVLVILLIDFFRAVAYAEIEHSGGEDDYSEYTYGQRDHLDKAQHTEGRTAEENQQGDEFIDVVFE